MINLIKKLPSRIFIRHMHRRTLIKFTKQIIPCNPLLTTTPRITTLLSIPFYPNIILIKAKNKPDIFDNTWIQSPNIIVSDPKFTVPYISAVPKIHLEALNKKAVLSVIKAKPPVHIYESSKINDQLKNNHIFKKYIPFFEEKKLEIPFVIEKFPTHGISGSFTIPPQQREQLFKKDLTINNQFAYTFVRYLMTMYGGKEIPTIENIILRVNQLFTHDTKISAFTSLDHSTHGLKNYFPMVQHWLALDMLNLFIPPNTIKYPSNFNVSLKKVSLQKQLEIDLINHSNKNNKDEILVIDNENPDHVKILNANHKIISTVALQPNVDSLAYTQVIGLNEKVVYPIDAKIIGYPENNLNILNAHRSISPNLQLLQIVSRMKGQLKNQIDKLPPYSTEVLFFKQYYTELDNIFITLKKAMNFSKEEAFNSWLQQFHYNQIQRGLFICNDMSFLPSIIARAYEFNAENYYYYLQTNNPTALTIMIKEAQETIKFLDHFPELKDYKNYNVYETQLAILSFLQKHNMLENYYKIRSLLLIEDLHHV